MIEHKFTPKPWYIKKEGIPEIWYENTHIADMCEIREETVAPTEAETLANAHLVQASPDLLEACELAEDMISKYRNRVMKGELTGNLISDDYVVISALRTAIAKTQVKD